MESFLQGLEGYLGSSPLLAFIAVFLGGVLTSFTPMHIPDDTDNGRLYWGT